jgi:hypothetical protein
MSNPVRKPNWQQELRQSSAVAQLQCGRPDRFPLQELQKLTDDLIRTTSLPTSPLPLSLNRREVPRFSEDCDILLVSELKNLKNELYVQEAGIIACIHVLTFEQARGQLVSIKPDANKPDVFFETKLPVYLQCLILAHQARSEVCSVHEARAARELFAIVTGGKRGDFPSIWRLLRAICQESRPDLVPLLPDELVTRILKNNKFKENLRDELEQLRTEQRWSDAYTLVSGLRDLVQLPRAVKHLQDAVPGYPMWAKWRPSRTRIASWTNDALLGPFREKLGPVFELEGPDFTGQQRETLRASSPGAFVELSDPRSPGDRSMLDRVLFCLDQALLIGQESIALVVYLCVESRPLQQRAILQLETALSLGNDSFSKKLGDYLRVIIHNSSPNDKMMAFAGALPIITRWPHLREVFGADLNIRRLAPPALSAVQKKFCASLLEPRPSERYALSVQSFGRALLEAEWLHEHWWPQYIEMLRKMPTEMETRASFRVLENSSGPLRQAHIDHLGTKLGGSIRKDATAPALPAPVIEIEDEIWYEPMDVDRDKLRGSIRRVRNIETLLAVACVKQSRLEHDTIIRELKDIILGDTDQICVNLATFLGSRAAANFQIDECWKALLLHMMRQRPHGLLDRCGKTLLWESWQNWIQNLRRIFGDRHLEPHESMGFTMARISQITTQKMAVRRSLSTSTTSTVSTGSSGRYSTARMSTVSDLSDMEEDS